MSSTNNDFSDWQVSYPTLRMRTTHILRSQDWADCTFHFVKADATEDSDSLSAHRLLLAMASPVFAAMFYNNIGDKNSPVNITDFDRHIFSKMFDYIYTDSVHIPDIDIAIELCRAANKYILVHLEHECVKYLLENLSPENACKIYEFACIYTKAELAFKCLEMFGSKTLDVIASTSFINAELDTLTTIYSLDSLNIDNELDLFYALIDYSNGKLLPAKSASLSFTETDNEVESKCDYNEDHCMVLNDTCETDNDYGFPVPVRRALVPGLVENIRFCTLTAAEFGECRNVTDLLTKDEILALSMNIASPIRSDIPMPKGFTTTRASRIQVDAYTWDATFPITLRNFSKCTIYRSKMIYVRKLPLKIILGRTMRSGITKGFWVEIECILNKHMNLPWTCDMHTDIEIVPFSRANTCDIMLRQAHNFNLTNKKQRALVQFPYNIEDPSLCIVKRDILMLKVHLAPGDIVLTGGPQDQVNVVDQMVALEMRPWPVREMDLLCAESSTQETESINLT